MLKLTLTDVEPAEIWVNPDAIISFQKRRYDSGTQIRLSSGYMTVVEEPYKVAFDLEMTYRKRTLPI